MFGRHKGQDVVTEETEIKKEEIIMPTLSTIDIVNSSKLEYLELLDRDLNDDEAHLKKYLYALERNKVDDTHTTNMGFINKLRKEGFKLLVKPSAIQQFKYAAIVFAENGDAVKRAESDKESVVYVGDIPDFALDKIIEAQDAKLKNITIHSNHELAVKYQQYKYTDPVLIAWGANPEIRFIDNKWQCTGGYFNPNLPRVTVGCVIAMWGEDGQPL